MKEVEPLIVVDIMAVRHFHIHNAFAVHTDDAGFVAQPLSGFFLCVRCQIILKGGAGRSGTFSSCTLVDSSFSLLEITVM